MRLEKNATRTGRRGMHIGFPWGGQKEIVLQEDVDICVRIILK
jgi:hypothetical protein